MSLYEEVKCFEDFQNLSDCFLCLPYFPIIFEHEHDLRMMVMIGYLLKDRVPQVEMNSARWVIQVSKKLSKLTQKFVIFMADCQLKNFKTLSWTVGKTVSEWEHWMNPNKLNMCLKKRNHCSVRFQMSEKMQALCCIFIRSNASRNFLQWNFIYLGIMTNCQFYFRTLLWSWFWIMNRIPTHGPWCIWTNEYSIKPVFYILWSCEWPSFKDVKHYNRQFTELLFDLSSSQKFQVFDLRKIPRCFWKTLFCSVDWVFFYFLTLDTRIT